MLSRSDSDEEPLSQLDQRSNQSFSTQPASFVPTWQDEFETGDGRNAVRFASPPKRSHPRPISVSSDEEPLVRFRGWMRVKRRCTVLM